MKPKLDKDTFAVMAKTTYNRNLKKAAAEEKKRIISLLLNLQEGYYRSAAGERYRAIKVAIETIERNK